MTTHRTETHIMAKRAEKASPKYHPIDRPINLLWRDHAGRHLCLGSVDVAEFLFGDRFAGWIRDHLPIDQWALEADFECNTLSLAGGVVHSCTSDDSFLIGIELPGEPARWTATR